MFGFGKKTTVVLKINGMHCHHCADKVNKTLSALPGVSKVTIDLEGKSATVVAGDKFDRAAAVSAVAAAGFEVAE